MTHARKHRLGVIMALGAMAAVTPGAAAGAGQVFRETIHDEGSFVLEDFCDQPGMTVDVAFAWTSGFTPSRTDALVWTTSCSTAGGPRCSPIRPTANP